MEKFSPTFPKFCLVGLFKDQTACNKKLKITRKPSCEGQIFSFIFDHRPPNCSIPVYHIFFFLLLFSCYGQIKATNFFHPILVPLSHKEEKRQINIIFFFCLGNFLPFFSFKSYACFSCAEQHMYNF